MQTHCQHRHIHFIDDMDSRSTCRLTLPCPQCTVHCSSQRIPCTQSFHIPATDNLNLQLLIPYSIVEEIFFMVSYFVEQILIVCKIHRLMGFIHHITQFISKHTTIPECSLCNILFCHVRCQFLPEGPYQLHGSIFSGMMGHVLTGIGQFQCPSVPDLPRTCLPAT